MYDNLLLTIVILSCNRTPELVFPIYCNFVSVTNSSTFLDYLLQSVKIFITLKFFDTDFIFLIHIGEFLSYLSVSELLHEKFLQFYPCFHVVDTFLYPCHVIDIYWWKCRLTSYLACCEEYFVNSKL